MNDALSYLHNVHCSIFCIVRSQCINPLFTPLVMNKLFSTKCVQKVNTSLLLYKASTFGALACQEKLSEILN